MDPTGEEDRDNSKTDDADAAKFKQKRQAHYNEYHVMKSLKQTGPTLDQDEQNEEEDSDELE